jgi:hypothetical protein
MAKGAMGVDPKKTKQKSPTELGLTRLSPGVYRDKFGNTTDSRGKVTRYASNNKDKRSIANPAPAKPTQLQNRHSQLQHNHLRLQQRLRKHSQNQRSLNNSLLSSYHLRILQ